jgi:hypothetical protein
MTRATPAKRVRAPRNKPRVNVKCLANIYAGPNERIIAFSFPGAPNPSTGGLIAFRHLPDGQLLVEITRVDDGITVRVPKGNHR